MEGLLFMALENVIMKVAAKGAVFARKRTSRYACFSNQASDVAKNQGGKNDFIKLYTSVTGVFSISGLELGETPLLTTLKSDAP